MFSAKEKSILTEHPEICYEVRRLVQAFLDARAAVVPAPPRPQVHASRNEESEESQEDYGEVDLDLYDLAFAELDNGKPGPVENSYNAIDAEVGKVSILFAVRYMSR